MFVLDTCLVSEFINKAPNAGVVGWLGAQQETELAITTLTLGELVKGIERLPSGRKRAHLEDWLENSLVPRFDGRTISFDTPASIEWGKLCARLEAVGATMPAVDSQIAAICLIHGAHLVTRNSRDFVNSGVDIVNPWV